MCGKGDKMVISGSIVIGYCMCKGEVCPYAQSDVGDKILSEIGVKLTKCELKQRKIKRTQ